jgi:hypothetical protein
MLVVAELRGPKVRWVRVFLAEGKSASIRPVVNPNP